MRIYLNNKEWENKIKDTFPGIELSSNPIDADVLIISHDDKIDVLKDDKEYLRNGIIGAYDIEEVIEYLKTIAPEYLQEFVDEECDMCRL
jgi:hypothetical protein